MRQDSETFSTRKPNPQQNANCLSVITFWYIFPVFRLGKKRDFDEDDLTEPLDAHKSSILGEKIARLWTEEVQYARFKGEQPSLTKVLFKCFWRPIFLYGFVLALMELGIRINQPLFLGVLLRYFNPANMAALRGENNFTEPMHEPMWMNRIFFYFEPDQSPILLEEAYLFGGLLCLTSYIAVSVLHPYMMAVMHLGMQVRVACCSLIYRKALRINMVSLSTEKAAGNVVNLLSNDVNRFDISLMFLHYLWIAPVQMLIGLYFMYREMGIAAVYGISSILLFIPLQAWFGHRTSVYRYRTAILTDERVRQMNEIVQGMQVIKMYTWEYAFADLIHNLRRREIKVLRETSYIRGVIMSFIMFTTRSGIFLTVLFYVLKDNSITAEKVFMVTSYYQVLRQTMTLFFPQGLAQIAESYVAIVRIRRFLVSDEAKVGDATPLYGPSARKPDGDFHPEAGGWVKMINLSAKYGSDVCLENINLEMEAGELTAIVGQVGSGKSCLLSVIMGELEPFHGRIIVNGEISYASQEPWLFVGSVRQNILFGRPYEPLRYRRVVRVCALERDFTLLPYGDRTIVGERGISLSGGQRARVNLARAVYKEADIYLLDDPLSAVDTHVGKHLFDQCISGFLSHKCVVLVTHQLQHLRNCKQIVIMDEGEITAKGDFHTLQLSGVEYAHFFGGDDTSTATTANRSDTSLVSQDKKLETIIRNISHTSALRESVIDKEGIKFQPREEAEMRTYGAVEATLYKEYFRAGGNCCVIFWVFELFIMAQIFASSGDYFLSQWVADEESRTNNVASKSAFGGLSRNLSIIIFSSLICATIVTAIVRSLVFFTVCMRASVTLHNRMFDSIITASMLFFNTNSSGRILNRFSKDLGAVDEFLPNAMIDFVQILLNLVGAVVIIGLVSYWLLIPTLFVCISFYYVRRYYIYTSRSVKRLDGIARSPVFGHLNATLQGLPTIRASQIEPVLVAEFDRLQDIHSSAWFMFIATSRAFSLWLDLICTLYVAIVTFSFLLFVEDPVGSEVGLAITQCIGLTGLFQWGMRQSAEMENQMTSVERVLEFTRVEHEPDLKSMPDKKPPPGWPWEGKIEYKDLSMQYKPNQPPVLRDLNFVVEPREKIGIVGRTGAGKSSLMASLFRLSPYTGTITIDGLDCSQMGLHDLRKRISIIPQEPVIFSGTLRYNLDPFKEYEDEAMVDALIVVEIRAALIEGPACLNLNMMEGGANISVGERQMVCLARAILRNNVILVMDEATANVDPQTDKFIQTTIRTRFSECTVLTIAHRLHTIMDSDKVLVMDAGIAVEYDHPHILLQNSDGYFTKMVTKTGNKMESGLRAIAKETYDNKNK